MEWQVLAGNCHRTIQHIPTYTLPRAPPSCVANNPMTEQAAAQYAASRFGLAGRTALITGGTKGIGKACVEHFARLGRSSADPACTSQSCMVMNINKSVYAGASVFTCARDNEQLQKQLAAWQAEGLQVQVPELLDDTVAQERCIPMNLG
jgi:hypothetical protein